MQGTAVPSSLTTVPKSVRVAFCTSYRQIKALSTSLATIGLPKLASGTYISQTGRLLGTRLAEHRAAVKYAKTDVSAVAEHVWERQHSMNFDGTTILAQEHDVHRRCLLESWFIQRSSTINREVGPLPQLYRCLF